MIYCPAEIAEIAERGYAPCHADSKQVIQQDKKFLLFPPFLRDIKIHFCGTKKNNYLWEAKKNRAVKPD